MPQIKKPEVEQAILRSAFELFSRRGYAAATLPQIAKGAGISPANIYIYFGSKLDVLWAIYDPWLRGRIERLQARIAAVAAPRERVRMLLTALWRDIPRERNGFANNAMQAVSTSTPEEGYDPALLAWVEDRVAAMMRDAVPPARRRLLGDARFSHVLMMAFDGFVINHHLRPGAPCSTATIDLVCDLILGVVPRSTARAAARKSASPGRRRLTAARQ
ncbi:MAG: TetR/AcrR family transcriptional regulator [Burkholderiales bacterium]|nr:TetR/AcrR family transcriptional regulator [Burkholderiales bacterium]